VLLGGQTLLEHATRAALSCPEVAHVVVVAPPTHVDDAADAVRVLDDTDRIDVVAGGADRGASVAAGVRALHHDDGIVLVHDAARALAPPELFTAVVHAVRAGHPAVVPGLPVPDTIKEVDAAGRVTATPDRCRLRAVQTPQGFLREVLEHAHAVAGAQAGATDDAGLVERAGGHVRVIDGDPLAHKITTPADLVVAEHLLEA
jgi:2-C-methyl-D-erythritol 4-phosphate cytidylyltransferase